VPRAALARPQHAYPVDDLARRHATMLASPPSRWLPPAVVRARTWGASVRVRRRIGLRSDTRGSASREDERPSRVTVREAELPDRLGEVIGLAQGMRLLARHAAVGLHPDADRHLVQTLEIFVSELDRLQRRCDSFVAASAHLRQSRVIARAREVKLRTMRSASEEPAVADTLRLLTLTMEDALMVWRALAALGSLRQPHPGVARLTETAIVVFEDYLQRLARHLAAS